MRRFLGFAVAACLAASFSMSLGAQETDQAAEIDDLEPSVDTSAFQAPGRPDVERVDLAAEREVSAPAPEPGAGGAKTNQQFQAMDELDLGTTSITGNQELPKVLYIVPWKRSDLGDLVGRPVNTLLDEVLSPVDPEVFRRHLDYYDGLYGESQEE